MQKGLQIGLLAVVAVLLGVVAYGLMDKEGNEVVKRSRAEEGTTTASAGDVTPAVNNNTANQQSTPAADQGAQSDLPLTKMEFDAYEHDFGTMDEGDKVEHIFNFTNTGDNPLVLSNCKGSCGCTVPTCPKEPIPPGGTGEIKVVFNSKGKKNAQTKRVTITANTEPKEQTILTIKAQVTPAPTEGQ